MQRGVAALLDGRDDVRMTVPDGGAHLAGREVEDFLAAGVPDVAALRPLHDFRIDVAAVANQVLAKIFLRAAARVHACFLVFECSVRPRQLSVVCLQNGVEGIEAVQDVLADGFGGSRAVTQRESFQDFFMLVDRLPDTPGAAPQHVARKLLASPACRQYDLHIL